MKHLIHQETGIFFRKDEDVFEYYDKAEKRWLPKQITFERMQEIGIRFKEITMEEQKKQLILMTLKDK